MLVATVPAQPRSPLLAKAAAFGSAALAAAYPSLALAVTASLTGSQDPSTALQTLGTWLLGLAGVAIPIICAVKGTHAVAEGRHLQPYFGAAIGGMVLCFGGSYILANY